MRRSPISRIVVAAALVLACAHPSFAQDDDENGDDVFKPAQPDFTLIGLPTTLRVPVFGSAFRVTHRFLRPLDEGDFGDLAGDLFGLDNGATIGLEFRFGLIPGGQVGFHRTADRTIEFFTAYSLARQEKGAPFDIVVRASVEAGNNFQNTKSPSLSGIISRQVRRHAAFYVEPIWVNNSNPLPGAVVDDNNTFMLGLGTRLRVRPTVYVVIEASPRLNGFAPGTTHGGFAIEKHAGGHQFQLNFSDSLATTTGQIAHGGPDERSWYMGFSISRKFF